MRRGAVDTDVELIKVGWRADLQEFGEQVLRPQRQKLGYTQEEMSEKVGLDQSRISRIERGYGVPRDYPTAKAIAHNYRLTQEQTDRWCQIVFGISAYNFHDIPHTVDKFTQQNAEKPDWIEARRMLREWITYHDHSVQDLAEEAGIHSRVLSEFFDGKATLKYNHILALYGAVSQKAEPLDRRMFLKVMGLLPLAVVFDRDLELETSAPPDLLESETAHLDTIYKVRLQSNSQLALELANATSNRLRKVLRAPSFQRNVQPLRRLLARVLSEQAIICREIALPNETLILTKPFIEELEDIARELQDTELFGLAWWSWGDTYHNMKQYDTALRWHKMALEVVENVDDQLELLRGLALDYVYLRDKKGFEETEIKAKKLIETGQFSKLDRVCETLEGLGRGQGLLKLPEAFKTLEEARNIYAKMESNNEKAHVRAVQLARSQVEIIKHLQPTDRRSLETYGKEGLRLAIEYEYQRHARLIEELLQELL